MIYQLENGKIVEISLDQYLELTDDDIEYLIAYNIGDEIENPFFNSSFNYKQVLISNDLEENKILDLYETNIVDKLIDLDLDKSIFEE